MDRAEPGLVFEKILRAGPGRALILKKNYGSGRAGPWFWKNPTGRAGPGPELKKILRAGPGRAGEKSGPARL